MKRFLLGLTGGLASGKSTVARWLREAGFLVVDADRLVAESYRSGGEGAGLVRELFGADALTVDGAVDHHRVAEIVFHDPAARHRLEAAIHPLVRRRFRELAENADGVVVLEATLLVEAGFGPDFDLVVSVEAEPSVQLERAIARGLDHASALARLEAQGSGEARRAGAGRILRNDGTLDDLRCEVDRLIEELRRKLVF